MKKKFSRKAVYSQPKERRVKDHPYVIPVMGIVFGFVVVAAMIIFSGGQTIEATDTKVVDITIDGSKQAISTCAETVGELIDKLEIQLIEEDSIEPSKTTPIIEDGMQIEIDRARPVTVFDGDRRVATTLTASKVPAQIGEQVGLEIFQEDLTDFEKGTIEENIIGEKLMIDRAELIYLNLYGTPIEVRTHSKTVEEFVKERNIVIGEKDLVQPSGETPITNGMQLYILTEGKKVVTQEEQINPPVEYVNDPSLPVGKTFVKEKGKPGKKVITYEITTNNDAEVSRRVLQEIVITQPVRELQAKGTKVAQLAAVVGDKAAMMSAAGIPVDQQPYADYIISRESGWNYLAQNRSSGAYGLCQALPGSKMGSAGSDWQTNPITQLRWCNSYASRYGGWAGAYSWWIVHHWW